MLFLTVWHAQLGDYHDNNPMKTDSFINHFFREFPGVFFTLIGEDEKKARKYKFTSVEVKEQAFRFDGVFLPKTKDDDIYFVEAQFKKEKDFYPRFFGESFVYLRQNQPKNNWRAVVLFPTKAADPGIHPHYQEFFESGRLLRLYLIELPKEQLEKFPLNLFRIILNSKQNAVFTVKSIVRQLPSQISTRKKQEAIIQMLVNLLMNKLPELSVKEIMKMVEPILSDIKKSRAYQEIAHERATEIARSMLQEEMSLDLIAKVTGLSKKEIRMLSKTMPAGKLAARKN
jgi:predicted transposase/invertase (TIGR01784 family)